MEIRKVKITRKTIEIEWYEDPAVFDAKERDNPLPSFTDSFKALPPVACSIAHFPPKYAENLTVTGMVMGEQGGARTVALVCRKTLDDASKDFVFKTPPRMLAHPTEEGAYSPPLTGEDAEKIENAIEEVKKYVRGDRAQGLIAFETETESEDGTGIAQPDLGEEMDLK